MGKERIRKKRRKLFIAQKGRCSYCSKKMYLGRRHKNQHDECTVEHIIPKFLGGTDAWDNIIAVCRKCNCEDYNPEPKQAAKNKLANLERETTMFQNVRSQYSSLRSPIQKIIMEQGLTHTHDVLRLQNRANWLVFLYCDLQPGHVRAATQSDPVWEGFTKGHYSMWKNDLGKLTHPVAFKYDDRLSSVSHNKIRGYVVRMRTNRLINLDEERQNGVQFQRIRTQITIPHFMQIKDKNASFDRKHHGENYVRGDCSIIPCEHTIWAWMYVGREEFWLDDLRKVSTIKFKRKDGRRNDEALLVLDGKTVSSATRYLPNNEKHEPYYYFPPT